MEVSKHSAEATVGQLIFNREYLLITNCKFSLQQIRIHKHMRIL